MADHEGSDGPDDEVLEELRETVRREAAAHRRWSSFSARAGQDGFRGAAKLLKALAVARGVIADGAMKLEGSPGRVDELVEEAADLARMAAVDRYPDLAEEAEEAGSGRAARFFAASEEATRSHRQLLAEALQLLSADEDVSLRTYQVCGLCGWTTIDHAPDECPTCGAGDDRFRAL